jgi:hypothetical protein
VILEVILEVIVAAIVPVIEGTNGAAKPGQRQVQRGNSWR